MKKILIIEDDQILRENTAELLGLANYSVITAANGKIGVELALREMPDLILCDILMPDLDGYGVLQIVVRNKKLSHIPFVFMTAKTDDTDFRKGMNMGASDYLTKPFQESELLSTIETRLKLRENIQLYEGNSNKNHFELLHDAIQTRRSDNSDQVYRKGSIIYSEDSPGNFIYYLLKGEVKIYKYHEYGKELIVDLINEGEYFGFTSFLSNETYQENAMAMSSVKLVKINKAELATIFTENPRLALQFIDLIAEQNKLLKNHLIHLVYDSVRKKTAAIILELHGHSDSDVIEISRNNLANLIGVAKETLIRTLADFKEEEIIQTSRKAVKIIDLEKLRKIN